MKRLFSVNPDTGNKTFFEATDDGGFMLHTVGDVEPILEGNKIKRGQGRAFYARDPDMWKVGSIPNIVLLKWAEDAGLPASKMFSAEMDEIAGRRLNDADYRAFKTADVRI